MIDSLIQQLHSADPAERRAAIKALANAKDPAALKPLAAVYRSDPDPELRDLALKAGRYIQQYAGAAPAAAGPSSAPPPPPPPPLPPRMESAAAGPSQRDIDLARGHLDAATGYMTSGDKPRAIESLARALSLNPGLQKDSFVSNLMVSLTGKAVPEALAMLTNPDARAALIERLGGKQKLKSKAKRGESKDASWGDVLIDFALYGIVTALTSIAILVFSIDMIKDLYKQLPATTTANGTTLTEADLDAISNLSVVALIPASLVSGVYAAIAIMIQGVAVHFAATSLLGGNGTLVYLYRKIVPLQTGIALLGGGLMVVMALSNSVEVFSGVVGIGSLILSVVGLYLLADAVGKVYDFGWGSGCAAIILGAILLFVVVGCGGCFLLSSLGRLAGS